MGTSTSLFDPDESSNHQCTWASRQALRDLRILWESHSRFNTKNGAIHKSIQKQMFDSSNIFYKPHSATFSYFRFLWCVESLTDRGAIELKSFVQLIIELLDKRQEQVLHWYTETAIRAIHILTSQVSNWKGPCLSHCMILYILIRHCAYTCAAVSIMVAIAMRPLAVIIFSYHTRRNRRRMT